MSGKKAPLLSERPHLERAMRIAQDHIHFSRTDPQAIADISRRLGISADAALALAIAGQITEEFDPAARED